MLFALALASSLLTAVVAALSLYCFLLNRHALARESRIRLSGEAETRQSITALQEMVAELRRDTSPGPAATPPHSAPR